MNLAQDIREAYRTLDLRPGASWAEVRSAYRRLARALHPDLNPGRRGEDMARVNRAYQRLGAFLASQPQPPAADGYRAYDFETWAPLRGQRPYDFETFQPQTRRGSARPAAERHDPPRPAPRPASWERPAPLAPVTPLAADQGSSGRAASLRPRESWRVVGLRRQGRDLVYQVQVSGHPRQVVLPLRSQRVCPLCGGSGHRQGGQGACPTCAGRGHLTSAHLAPVDLPANWTHGQLLEVPAPGLDGGVLVELLSTGREI